MTRPSIGQPAATPRRTQVFGKHALKRRSDRRAWVIAWALTLALHGGAALGFRWLPPLAAAPAQPQKPEPIRLVFSKPGPEPREANEPRVFTELPPDRADEAPDKADFLSNVTSRARDLVPGGDDALPRMQGEASSPSVKLENKGTPPRPSSASPPDPKSATARAADSPQQSDPRAQGPRASAGSGATSPQRPTDSPQSRSEVSLQEALAAGDSDLGQPEMDNPDGNAALKGFVSLNTTAWDYAPWMQRFGRQLMRRWVAPPAYYMGLLKEGGWALIEVEISRSGELLRLDLLEEQGHPSLIQAAQGAVRAMAPVERLPADFPEPTLILRLRMIYPKIRPR